MHVVYVEAGYPHPHGGGGAGTYVRLVAQELVQRGHRVSVVASYCSECPLEYDDNGIMVYRPKRLFPVHYYANKLLLFRPIILILRALETNIPVYRTLERLHHKFPIDLMEFTEGGDFFHAWHTSFPYIVHLHGSRYTFLFHSGRTTNRADWYHRKLELAFIRRASFIVSPSQSLLDIVGLEAGGLSVPTQVIPYPIDPRLLQPLASRPNGSTKKVLFAARNNPVKGGKVLLAAVPLVRQQIPDVEFHFFGFEPKLDQNVPEGVTLHPFVSKDELLAWYHTANICVIPSLWDNSPNTVYEAMIAGKPVVASRVGGIPELVIHEVTGLLVPPSDPDSLATAIIRILSDKSEQLDMGVKARERIQQLAALQPNVDQRLRLYNRIVRNAYV